MMIQKILISLLFIGNGVFAQDNIDIDGFLKELKPEPTVNLCKDSVRTNEEYIQCLQEKTDKNSTIDNVNFLAGIYAVNKEYDKAIKTYKINVAKGDKKATYYLAGIYNEALQQHDKAIPYFEKIKDYKDSTCQIGGIKAIVKYESWFKFLDKRKAKKRTLKFYDDEIKQGNVKAYGCKGLYYNSLKEYEDAEKAFLKGLEKGDKQNLFYLGNFYYYYKYNFEKSIHYYEESYKAGNMQAAHNLGNMYERSKEYDKAIPWYIPSAKSGDLKSLYNLANIYRENGKEETALKIYKKVGDLGLEDGYLAVWTYYTKTTKQYNKAIEYLKGCYNTGHKECARSIGRIYDEDLKEYDKAIKWHIRGYEMGDAESAFNLAMLYHVTLKDFKNAIIWYKKASDMGYVKAMNNLAVLYEDDLKDKVKAIEWYKKAAAQGHKKAKKQLKRLGELNE
ncbi:tetratricopeptide repeat protein [Sulfurimonas sp. HSL3-2]|uniref:SEL1-like repeat protein n=1 Tax=Hydrocurvibacter mobilis TaxID=3131936 RepID=UPI0031F77714